MGPIRFGIAAFAGAISPVGAAFALFVASLGCTPHNPPPVTGTPATPPPPCTTPEPLKINLKASPQINPGEKGEPLATVIRIYQLKQTNKLQSASFDDLLDHDKDVLQDEMVSMTEVTINPGDSVDPPVTRSPEAGYVAAVALFRRPAGNTWRAMKKLLPPDTQHCHAAAGGKSDAPSDGVVRFSLDENRVDIR